MSTSTLTVPNEPPPKRRHSEIMHDYDAHVITMETSMRLDDQNKTPSNQLLLSMAALLKETNEKVIQIAPITERVNALENEVKSLKESIIKLEFSQVANSVICRNLPLHPDAKNKRSEHYLQTEVMVNDLLLATQVKDQVKVVETIRFAASSKVVLAGRAPKGPLPVKITFGDKRQVNILFSGLKNLMDTVSVIILKDNQHIFQNL